MLLVLLLGCAVGSPPPEVTLTPDTLLDRIEALAASVPFSARGVEAVLGATLIPTSDSDYFAMYEATTAGGFAKVTLMAPKAGATNGGSVALRVDAPCLTADAAKARFGVAHRVPVHPGAPARTLEVWTHPQPWGELLLAFEPTTGCLAEATLRAR